MYFFIFFNEARCAHVRMMWFVCLFVLLACLRNVWRSVIPRCTNKIRNLPTVSVARLALLLALGLNWPWFTNEAQGIWRQAYYFRFSGLEIQNKNVYWARISYIYTGINWYWHYLYGCRYTGCTDISIGETHFRPKRENFSFSELPEIRVVMQRH